jgi:ubiquinone/menaquinone biosynthesis C-methylase UbiE
MTDLPHFVRDYRHQVEKLMAQHSLDRAMELAVGGAYETNGAIEADLLTTIGLSAGHQIIDIGCGSGRLSSALTNRFGQQISYLGTDVVPQLLDFARTRADKTYQFLLTDGLTIPADGASIDFVTAFSVFTHLKHREIKTYLKDVHRVLRPRGKFVFSFLHFRRHAKIALYTMRAKLLGKRQVHNQFMLDRTVHALAAEFGFAAMILPDTPLGQTVAVLTKSTS